MKKKLCSTSSIFFLVSNLITILVTIYAIINLKFEDNFSKYFFNIFIILIDLFWLQFTIQLQVSYNIENGVLFIYRPLKSKITIEKKLIESIIVKKTFIIKQIVIKLKPKPIYTEEEAAKIENNKEYDKIYEFYLHNKLGILYLPYSTSFYKDLIQNN